VKSSDLGLLGVSSASLRGFNFVYMRAERDMTIWGQLGPPMWFQRYQLMPISCNLPEICVEFYM
jgi:hypothetical protein